MDVRLSAGVDWHSDALPDGGGVVSQCAGGALPRYRSPIGIFIQFWFFLTPVIYALDRVAGPLAQLVRWLNPMASLVEFYREILYGNAVAFGQIPTPNLPALDSVLRVLLTALATLAIGYWYFQRRSGEFGERL